MKLVYVLFVVLVCSNFIVAQDQEAMMKQWESYMTPGPEHKMLADMVGEWEGDITIWMDPSQPPQTMKGKTVYESVMGGRYIVGHYSGNMMGMPFNGMDITGFDNALKVYQNIWIDNIGTGMMMTEGSFDSKSNSIIYKGKMVEPSGNKVNVRSVAKVIDKDHSIFEMFVDTGSGESKSMEIKYTRLK